MVLPCIALAQPNVDLRFKLGNAAGADRLEIFPDTATGSGDGGSNFQFEAAITPIPNAPVSPLITFGLFRRTHSGTVSDPIGGLPPTDVDYNVTGLSLGVGMSIRATNRLHFEAKFEFSGGQGEPDLTTPGSIWGATETDSYGATSFIVGTYYTITEPGVQLGLEVGAQSFRGDFQIHDPTAPEFVFDGTVKGSGGIVNFVVGFRF